MFMLTAALLLTASTSPVVPVDFRLAGQSTNVSGLPTIAPPGTPIPLAPQPSPEGDPDLAKGDASDNVAPPRLRFLMAHGFGRGVPLAFAVRQVVPTRVRVSYGSGVNTAQSVTWEGGKPWDDVLRAAVAPLGLHLVMSHMAVKIIE